MCLIQTIGQMNFEGFDIFLFLLLVKNLTLPENRVRFILLQIKKGGGDNLRETEVVARSYTEVLRMERCVYTSAEVGKRESLGLVIIIWSIKHIRAAP